MQGDCAKIAKWLEEIAALAGITAEFDERGVFEIELASGPPLLLEVDEASGILLLSADLFSVNAPDRLAVFERAMTLNHLGAGTGGATLGWDARRDMLVMSALTPIELIDEAAFLGLMTGFIGLVDEYRSGLPVPGASSARLTTSSVGLVRG